MDVKKLDKVWCYYVLLDFAGYACEWYGPIVCSRTFVQFFKYKGDPGFRQITRYSSSSEWCAENYLENRRYLCMQLLVGACCLVRVEVSQEFVYASSRKGNVMHGEFTLTRRLVTTSSRSGTVMRGAAPTYTNAPLLSWLEPGFIQHKEWLCEPYIRLVKTVYYYQKG